MAWRLREVHARVLTRTLQGGVKGAAAGAAASLATGAAVVMTTPAWLPVIGGTALVTAGTVVLWAALGGSTGALVAGTRAYVRFKIEERTFAREFPDINNETKENR